MITPILTILLLTIANALTLLFVVYLYGITSVTAEYINALILSVTATKSEEDHSTFLLEATEFDHPTCVNIVLMLRHVPQTVFVTMILLSWFALSAFAGNFSPTLATVTALSQAYIGVSVFKMNAALYTIKNLEQKYEQLDAQIFGEK